MWKLWNKLFGFEYVLFKWGDGYIIRRAVVSPTGIKYVTAYGSIIVVGENDVYRQWKYLT